MNNKNERAQLAGAQQAADQSSFWWNTGYQPMQRATAMNAPLLQAGALEGYEEAARGLVDINKDSAYNEAARSSVMAALGAKDDIAGGNTGQVFTPDAGLGRQAAIGVAGERGIGMGAVEGKMAAIARAFGLAETSGGASLGSLQNQIGALRAQGPGTDPMDILALLANAGFAYAGNQPGAQLKALPPSRSYSSIPGSSPGLWKS